MKTFWIQYFYGKYQICVTKCYVTTVFAEQETDARAKFIKANPNAHVRGVSNTPIS